MLAGAGCCGVGEDGLGFGSPTGADVGPVADHQRRLVLVFGEQVGFERRQVEWPAVDSVLGDECLGSSARPAQRGLRRTAVRTILVVDDDPWVRILARDMLADEGYRVLEASDGQDAIGVAARHPGPIHLLLTDVVMPGMNGCELAAGLTALLPGIKVMFMFVLCWCQ